MRLRILALGVAVCAFALGMWARRGMADGAVTLGADLDNLNGAWRFATDPADRGESAGWASRAFDDAAWRVLQAPGYWEPQGVTEARPGMAPKPRAGMQWTDYDGVGWYRKSVVVPREWAGKRLILRLGSVDDADRTFFNGVLVGETPITRSQAVLVTRMYRVDSKLVRAGAANVIAVKVTDGGGPGGLMGPDLCLVPEDALTGPVRVPGRSGTLQAQFANPPADRRILKIIHGWPDEPAAQDLQVRTLASQGFGGVVCNVSFDRYLQSAEKWTALRRAVTQARKAGMALWLYDEKGYPSGTAGGLTLKGHPEWEARGLLIADAISGGEEVDVAVPPGKLVLAAAYPVSGNRLETARATRLTPVAGRVRYRPQGRAHVMVVTEDRIYEGTHAANSLGDKQPYINLLMPQPTARFIELTHREYARRLGPDLGRVFVSTFTDEPSLMSLYLRRMPYRVLPWSPNLPGEFARRRRYALDRVLPLLVGGSSEQSGRARHDFWLTIGELVSECFFGQIQTACKPFRIASGGHLLMEEGLVGHVPLYGDFFRCLRRLDAPSMDCLTSVPGEVPHHVARLIGSAADLQGRALTMSETSDFSQVYRPAGDTRPARRVTEAEIRGACNRQFLGGINTITSYYTFDGLPSARLRALNAYVGRCSLLLTGGTQVTDVGVVYPVESVWTRFQPSRHMTLEAGEAAKVERAFRSASDQLFVGGRDFAYLDSRAIRESRVQNGALVHGPMRWRVVVLPCADTLPMAAWRKLEAFVLSGGCLIALSALPANSETAFPSAEVRAIAGRLFGNGHVTRPHRAGKGVGVFLPAGSAHMLVATLDSMVAPDVVAQEPIRATHRRIGGSDVYFLANDGAQAWKGTVGVHGRGAGSVWDPLTGKARPIADPRRIALSLEPYAGVVLRFPRADAPRRMASVAVVSRAAVRPLVAARVVLGAGEHVAGTISPVPGKGGQVWEVAGTLKRSDVDTFLFAGLQFDGPQDLSRDEFLRFRVTAPGGQAGAPQLIVIVSDRRGVQHFLETGRFLSEGGAAEVAAPLRAFVHAPFSAGPAAALDWGAVTAVSIGWGGHFGKEGDRIAFTVGGLSVGRSAPK